MMTRRSRFLVWFCLVALPASAAEPLWLNPLPARPQPGEVTGLELRRGSPPGDSVAFDDGQALRFQLLTGQGRQNLSGPRAQMERAGVKIVSYDATIGGEDLFAKAVLVAGQVNPGAPLRYSELGQRLELVPQTDPVLLRREERKLEIQLLYEREPLADTVVTASRIGGGALTGKTDEIGLARFQLPTPGFWIVSAEFYGRCEECDAPKRRTSVATLSIAVGGGPSR